MKNKKTLICIISAVCSIIAACAVIYVFRKEIREFLDKICAKANELKEKAVCKINSCSSCTEDDDFEDDFSDDDDDIEVEITFSKAGEPEEAPAEEAAAEDTASEEETPAE